MMLAPAENAVLPEPSVSLPPEQLQWLARTYDQIAHPVWIYDLTSRCVYRNAPAEEATVEEAGLAVFEISDYEGRVVGHLSTVIR